MTYTPSPVVQQEDFYPFGLAFNSYSRESSVPNKYLFNGKELQTDLGLNLEDYGARMYDPALGRWWAIDGMTDRMRSNSPYEYAFDNPIVFTDIDGNIPWPKIFGKGRIAKSNGRNFGMHLHPVHKINKMHNGLDIIGSTGTPIYALAQGKAHLIEDPTGGGHIVSIDHGDGYQTMYMHTSVYKVKEGDEIKEGQLIAEVGNSGIGTGPHLHLAVLKNGAYIDPEDIEDLQVLLHGKSTAEQEATGTGDEDEADDGVPNWVKGNSVLETGYWLLTGREKDMPRKQIGGGWDMTFFGSGSSGDSGTSSSKKSKKKPDADKEAAKKHGGWW